MRARAAPSFSLFDALPVARRSSLLARGETRRDAPGFVWTGSGATRMSLLAPWCVHALPAAGDYTANQFLGMAAAGYSLYSGTPAVWTTANGFGFNDAGGGCARNPRRIGVRNVPLAEGVGW